MTFQDWLKAVQVYLAMLFVGAACQGSGIIAHSRWFFV